MKPLCRLLLILNVFWLVLGCDQSSSPKQRRTDFSDSGFPNGNQSKEEAGPLLSGQRDFDDLVPAASIPSFDKSPPPVASPPNEPFKIAKPKLVINVDKSEMDFQFEVITASGKEAIHLKGPLDKSASPWVVHLYAVDQKILEERRVSASVTCLTAYYCDTIGVEIHYTINGKPETVYRESGVEGPRLAMSGDYAEEEPEEASPGPVSAEPKSDAVTLPESNSSPALEVDPETGLKPPPAPPAKAGQVKPAPRPKPERVVVAPPKPKARKVEAPKLEDIPPEERPNAIYEVRPPMYVPKPPQHEFRVRNLPEEPPALVSAFQAYGLHQDGLLKNSTFIPGEIPGLVRAARLLNQNTHPDKDSSGAFTTSYGLDYLQEVAAELLKKYPNDRMVLGAVSNRTGGPRGGHSSHQTGLDFDIYLMSKSGRQVSFRAIESEGGPLSPEFDVAKSYDMMKTLVTLRPNQFIIGFLHRRLIQALCAHAKEIGEPVNDPRSDAFQVFSRLTPERRWNKKTQRFYFPFTHHDHVHVRLKCNPNDKFCRDVDLSPVKGNCR